jgi:mRNA-degrading endonuclease toxin of MazEF toxin-antitoxin module
MPINQREVYLLPHPFDTTAEAHPHIILSHRDANNHERTFIAVMITSSPRKDDFSFDLVDDMFEKPLAKQGCHVRMHLLTLALDEDISSHLLTKMKKQYFDELMRSIGDIVFNFEFSPL